MKAQRWSGFIQAATQSGDKVVKQIVVDLGCPGDQIEAYKTAQQGANSWAKDKGLTEQLAVITRIESEEG